MLNKWVYEPDEVPKRKHSWAQDEPGHVLRGDTLVGKCPKGLTIDQAEALLNEGIPFYPRRWREDHPQRVFIVHEGWVYRATVTNPGRSYHGFPEMIERLPADRGLRESIQSVADQKGFGKEVGRWLASKRTKPSATS